MKLSEQIWRCVGFTLKVPEEWARKVTQLEFSLAETREENKKLSQIVAERTPFIYAVHAADDLVEALHQGIIFDDTRFVLAEFQRKRKQCLDKNKISIVANDSPEE